MITEVFLCSYRCEPAVLVCYVEGHACCGTARGGHFTAVFAWGEEIPDGYFQSFHSDLLGCPDRWTLHRMLLNHKTETTYLQWLYNSWSFYFFKQQESFWITWVTLWYPEAFWVITSMLAFFTCVRRSSLWRACRYLRRPSCSGSSCSAQRLHGPEPFPWDSCCV